MKAHDLIALLQTLPPQTEVLIEAADGPHWDSDTKRKPVLGLYMEHAAAHLVADLEGWRVPILTPPRRCQAVDEPHGYVCSECGYSPGRPL